MTKIVEVSEGMTIPIYFWAKIAKESALNEHVEPGTFQEAIAYNAT